MTAIGLASYQAEIRCEWVSGSLAHGGNLVIMSGADIRPIFSSAGTVPFAVSRESHDQPLADIDRGAQAVLQKVVVVFHEHHLSCDVTQTGRFRRDQGEEGLELRRKATIDTAVAIDAVNPKTRPYCDPHLWPGTSRYRRA